jgi:hypothetical protein
MFSTMLESIPGPILALLVVSVTVGVSMIGQAIVNRYLPHHVRRPHNDIVGFVIAVVGALYAVLLGFVVIALWEQHREASDIAQREAAALRDFHRYSRVVEPDLGPIHRLVVSYGESAVAREWPAMAHGQSDRPTHDALHALLNSTLRLEPKNAREQVVYPEGLRRLGDLAEARDQRLLASRDRLPTMLWVTLVLGATITTGYIWLFGVENRSAHLLFGCGLAALFGLGFYLILALDNPFAGSLRVEPEAMRLALEHIGEGR